MPDRYLSFSRVAVSFGALVSVAALRSTTTVLSMESWMGGGEGQGGSCDPREIRLGSRERTLFTAS